MPTGTYSYSREDLLSIQTSCVGARLPLSIYHILQDNGICSDKPTHRGHRSRRQHQTPTLVFPYRLLHHSTSSAELAQPDPRLARRGREATLSAPASVSVATYNVRTLTKDSRLYELTHFCKQHNIDILCIQEHRRVLTDETSVIEVGKGWTAYLVSARTGGHGGVSFLLAPHINPAILSFEKLHD